MPDEATTPDPTTPTTSPSSATPTTTRPLPPHPSRGISLRTQKGAAWQALQQFEQAASGRPALADTLAAAPLDLKQKNLLALMLDPRRGDASLATLCADAGVAAHEVIHLFREAAMSTTLAAGTAQMARHMPAVIESVAVAAQDRREPCLCTVTEDEAVFLPASADCPTCAGRGFLVKKGRFEQQQLFLEALTFLKRGGGVAVQVTQTQTLGVAGGFFDKFVKATDGSAYETGIVEATVVGETRHEPETA